MTDKLLNLPKSKYMEVYTDKIDNFKNTISMKIDNPWSLNTSGLFIIWAMSRENVSSRIFDQVRFKSACSATEAS